MLCASTEVEFLIAMRTRECALNCVPSEYPYGGGERRLVINTKESAHRW
jgi:hypothetical protein